MFQACCLFCGLYGQRAKVKEFANLEKKAEHLEKKAEAGVVAAVDSDGR